MSTQLSYDVLEQKIIQELKKNLKGVLATSDGNFVTARQMMLIPDGLLISCFTSSNTRKFKQMSVNKNVALAINNIQIEGEAKLKGHTSDPKNESFLKAFEKLAPSAYNYWRDGALDPNSGSQLIEISPKRIALYVVESGTPYVDVLNIDKKTAIRIKYGEDYE